MRDVVLKLELSGADLDAREVMRRALADFDATMAFNASRLLVVVSVADVVRLEDELHVLASDAMVQKILLLLVGPSPGAGMSGVPLPRMLSERRVQCLWAGHERGVLWSMGGPKVDGIPGRDSPDLMTLVEVLSAAEIFDRVTEVLMDEGWPVASPGLHAVRSSLADHDHALGGLLASEVPDWFASNRGGSGESSTMDAMAPWTGGLSPEPRILSSSGEVGQGLNAVKLRVAA